MNKGKSCVSRLMKVFFFYSSEVTHLYTYNIRTVLHYATGWDAGVHFPAGVMIEFSLCHRIQTTSGVHSSSYSVGTRCFCPGVKRPGREADHSPPSSGDVENACSYTSTPLIRLHGVIIKQEIRK
jgi:hypothetical protein